MQHKFLSPYIIGKSKFYFSRTYIMGILNVTPDSFSDGGKYFSVENAVKRGMEMVEEGADILDIGGESTRPNSESIPVEEELRRTIPVIEQLARNISVPISIDTTKSKVAEEALNAGATIVNDISGLTFDEKMVKVVARNRATLVVMHIQGNPKTMQQNPHYENVVEEVKSFLYKSISKAKSNGISQIFIDPGIGFGKTLEHNLSLLKNLNEFASLGCPILVGTSRKSFIGKLTNDMNTDKRLEGTAASVALSIANGANVVRVHDVKEMKKVVLVADAIKYSR
ncbi:MAG: dihydropteroate synthase [Ignavibacteriales bacterium]|nr:dihydropteroate synthase [Ignavibacteriales bacterium]